MKVNREEFLKDLMTVRAGLSSREFIEQSSCFVFRDGYVMTFNDEVACRKDIGIKITGAVQASAMLSILEKMDDPELDVLENDTGELEFRGKRKRFGIVKDASILLPTDRIEKPKEWDDLHEDFIKALTLTQHCASTDESKFALTCIHIHPKWVESCDNFQIMRCKIPRPIHDEYILARGASLSPVASLLMEEVCVTRKWIHFRNKSGLIYSCRRYEEDYPELTKQIKFDGHSISIPKALGDAAERAAVFAADKTDDPLINVALKPEKMCITGTGLSGWYQEIKKVVYDGPEMAFSIAPELLRHVAEKYTEALITEGRLKVVGDGWTYVTVLGAPEEARSEKPVKEQRRKRDQENEDAGDERETDRD